MKKTSVIGAIATALTLGLAGGTLAPTHGAFAAPGWDDRGLLAGDPVGRGPGMGGPGMGGPGTGGALRLFEAFDRSGNGEISQADIDAVRGERLAAFDSDGDGVLTLDEYEVLWLDAMRDRMVRGFQQLDGDGDALVTEAEFCAPYDRLVTRFDADGDGLITETEVRTQLRGRRADMRGWAGRRHGAGWGAGGPAAD